MEDINEKYEQKDVGGTVSDEHELETRNKKHRYTQLLAFSASTEFAMQITKLKQYCYI